MRARFAVLTVRMTSAHTGTGAIILAAGSASRYGALKQVIAIDGEPMVRRMARSALAARLHPVVVVVGSERDRVIECLNNLDVHPVDNADWAAGMGTSLSIGIRAPLDQSATLQAVMVLLGDQPAVGLDDLERMITTHAAAPNRILAAQDGANLGPPCIFPMTYAGELLELPGPNGARVLLDRHAAEVDGFDLPSAFRDIDTPADYESWQASRGQRSPGELG